MEEFREIPMYNGIYLVSNLGRLKSVRKGNAKILKGSISKKGYRQYGLSCSCKNLSRTYLAHQLVAIVFMNHTPSGNTGLIIDHIDSDKLNNNVTNLRLVTSRFNSVEYRLNRISSKLYGVVKSNHGTFYSRVWHNNTAVHLGSFNSEIDAHKRSLKYIKDNKLNRLTY